MACLVFRNREGITEGRKGAVVEITVTEGVATILKSMTMSNPRTTKAMDSLEGDIMMDTITKEILHITLTKGMLAITLQIITNNSILSSKVIRISGAMVDREDTQVGVETLEVEEDKEDQVGSTHPTVLATMGVCSRTFIGVTEA